MSSQRQLSNPSMARWTRIRVVPCWLQCRYCRYSVPRLHPGTFRFFQLRSRSLFAETKGQRDNTNHPKTSPNLELAGRSGSCCMCNHKTGWSVVHIVAGSWPIGNHSVSGIACRSLQKLFFGRISPATCNCRLQPNQAVSCADN